jgi:hypothetical protein
MRFTSNLNSVLFLMFFALSVFAFAQPKKALAILEFSGDKASGVNLEERQALAELTRGHALKALPRSGWSVMTRDNMQALLPPGTDLADCAGDECIITTGRKMQADYIVTGRVTRLGTNLQVIVQLYDVRSGSLVGTAQPRGASIDAVIDPLEREVLELFREVGGVKSGSSLPEVPPPPVPLPGLSTPSNSIGSGNGSIGFEIASEPPGARVEMDGETMCSAAPCRKVVSKGPHSFRFRLADHLDTVLWIEVGRTGQKETVRMRPNYSGLSVRTTPSGAMVALNGRKIGTTPLAPMRVNAGPAIITISKPCYTEVRKELLLQYGETRAVDDTLDSYKGEVEIVAVDMMSGKNIVAEVWGGNVKLGETPFRGPVNTCLPFLELWAQGYSRVEARPTFSAGQVIQTTVTMREGMSGPRPSELSSDRSTFGMMGVLGFPVGEFAEGASGAASFGLGGMIEYNHLLLGDRSLFLQNTAYVLLFERDANKMLKAMDVSSGQAWEADVRGWTQMGTLVGLRIGGTPRRPLYASGQVGLNCALLGKRRIEIDDLESRYESSSALSFAYSFGAGFKLGVVNVGVRYLNFGNPEFEVLRRDDTGFESTGKERYKIGMIALTTGFEF